MKLTIRVLAVFALVVLSGCATSSHVISGTVRPPIDPALVRLYTSPPPKSEAIAILTVESSGWTTQGEKDIAVAKLKEEAASLGANGVLLTGMGTRKFGRGRQHESTDGCGMDGTVNICNNAAVATAILAPAE